MTNQKLFEAIQRVCGFTALESDMFEIIKAVEADKMPLTETIELDKFIEAEGYEAGSITQEIWEDGVRRGANWQSSQPNPHRIEMWHLLELNALVYSNKLAYSRMVEILNEIAAGKHKERIEI